MVSVKLKGLAVMHLFAAVLSIFLLCMGGYCSSTDPTSSSPASTTNTASTASTDSVSSTTNTASTASTDSVSSTTNTASTASTDSVSSTTNTASTASTDSVSSTTNTASPASTATGSTTAISTTAAATTTVKTKITCYNLTCDTVATLTPNYACITDKAAALVNESHTCDVALTGVCKLSRIVDGNNTTLIASCEDVKTNCAIGFQVVTKTPPRVEATENCCATDKCNKVKGYKSSAETIRYNLSLFAIVVSAALKFTTF
ncbi:uncharacterized protein LOC141904138 [Tubulanus polymorphus]|uniref:uncharacterized protein LOC141904138 n=1 Tax=Tubulanus polymorphus TaxID=672921 RepID=UPI003DA4C4D8